MKAVTITRTGGPDVLQVRDYPDPRPAQGELTIRVGAAGVNFADILARKGLYPDGPGLPGVVGYEVAGEVLRVGKSAAGKVRRENTKGGESASPSSPFKPGDRVVALTRFSGYSEIVTVPLEQVFSIPDTLTFPEAAAIPVNYLTAWQLVEMGGLKRGDNLLIHNAGGGVGLAALSIARHLGARTLGTASPGKHERLKERGLDVAIDYRRGDWVKAVLHHTDGRGADVIFDPLGGANWKQSWRALRSTGRLGMFGVSEVTTSTLPGPLRYVPLLQRMPFYTPVQLMNNNKGVYGVNIGRLWSEKEKIRQWAETILSGVDKGWIRPHVDAIFTFEEAPVAHRYIEERKNFGKVILTPDE
ncbi:MAG: medium chain dehydrogenase/reductase family protein [Cyclonatronaceae bacterium]